jgi:hypothetical protein
MYFRGGGGGVLVLTVAAYLLKAITVEAEKQLLLCNS